MNHIETMKKALDALEGIPTAFGNVAHTAAVGAAIESLRAAIAQPEPYDQQALEHVAERLPEKLYTHPAQTYVSMSDDAVLTAIRKDADDLLDFIYEHGTWSEGVDGRWFAVARAIERAVRGDKP